MFEKYAEVKYYGPEFPKYKDEPYEVGSIDVLDVIHRLYPNDYPDIVLTWGPHSRGLFPALKNFDKAKCLRVIWLLELHNDIMRPEVYNFLKNGGADLVLKSHDYPCTSEYAKRLHALGIPVEWYPHSIDPNLFFDRKLPKIYDVTNIGQFTTQHYPVRYRAHEVLSNQNEIKYMSPTRYIVGEEYARIINQTKIFITDTSSFRFAIPKLYEIMACNTLLLSTAPRSAEAIGLKSGVNYVEINDYAPEARQVNPKSFMEPIRYYLQHPAELAQIAQRGHDLVHSKHTHDIRAQEMIKIFEKYL
jgi:hypothetical protein